MPPETDTILQLRPALYIDGQLHEALTADLLEVVIEDAFGAPSRCAVRIANLGRNPRRGFAYKYFDLHDFDFGTPFTVWQGIPPNTLWRLFDGRLNLIEGIYPDGRAPEVLIQGTDAFQELRMRERTRIFESMSDADIAGAVASEHGLAADISLDGPVHVQIVQLNQDDYSFLCDRVRAAGGDMRIEGNTLIVRAAAPDAGDVLELSYGETLRGFSVRADLRGQCTGLGVAGWNMRDKEVIRKNASEEDLGGGSSGKSGGRAMEEAFGQRLETMVDAVPRSDEEAQALAAAAYRQKAGRFILGEGRCDFSPELRLGRRVRLTNLGPLFDGFYEVIRLRTLYDAANGLRQEFEVRRSRIGQEKKSQPKKTKQKKEARDARKRSRDSRKKQAGRTGTGGRKPARSAGKPARKHKRT